MGDKALLFVLWLAIPLVLVMYWRYLDARNRYRITSKMKEELKACRDEVERNENKKT